MHNKSIRKASSFIVSIFLSLVSSSGCAPERGPSHGSSPPDTSAQADPMDAGLVDKDFVAPTESVPFAHVDVELVAGPQGGEFHQSIDFSAAGAVFTEINVSPAAANDPADYLFQFWLDLDNLEAGVGRTVLVRASFDLPVEQLIVNLPGSPDVVQSVSFGPESNISASVLPNSATLLEFFALGTTQNRVIVRITKQTGL